MIFWQKATRDPSLGNLDRALHEIHVLHPYQFVGCGCYAGVELLGKCGLASYSNKSCASVLHVGPI